MLLLFVQALLGTTAPAAALRTALADTLPAHLPDTLQSATADQPDALAPLDLKPELLSRRERRERARAAREQERRTREFNSLTQEERDSVFSSQVDSLVAQKADSLASRSDSDTTRNPRAARPFLDDQLSGKNTDSLVYDVRNKKVYVYNEGDVSYQNRNLKADYMQIDMNTKLIYAYGKPDSVDGKWTVTKPEFTEGGTAYQMDTITYNLDTQKAKIKGVATQQGDGWLVGGSVKKNARQHLQHRARQVHHLRPDRPPALLPGHDQGEGDSREKGGHRTGLPGHGGRTDLFPLHTRGLLPDQHGPQVGSADAHLRRGDLQGILPPRPGLLHHAG